MILRQTLVVMLFILLVVMGIALAGTAVAGDGGPVEEVSTVEDLAVNSQNVNPIGFLDKLYQNIKTGNWGYVAALVIIGLTYLVRMFREKIPYLDTDRGGVLVALGSGLASAIALAILSGNTIDLEYVARALEHSVEAAGGYVVVRRMLLRQTRELK